MVQQLEVATMTGSRSVDVAPESEARARLLTLKRAWPADRVFAERAGIDHRRLQFVGWLALTGRVGEFPAEDRT